MSWQDNLRNILFSRKNYKKMFYNFLKGRGELIPFIARTNEAFSEYLKTCDTELYVLNAFAWIDWEDELDRWSELNQHWQVELKKTTPHPVHNSKVRVYNYATIKQEFKLFLVDHGVFDRFKSNLSLPAMSGSSYDVYSLNDLFKQENPRNWVLESFSWSKATENDVCWSNIHHSWYEMVK